MMTYHFKVIMVCAVLACLALPAHAQQPAPTDPDRAVRADLARQILLIQPLAQDLDRTITQALARYPETDREELGRLIRLSLDVDEINTLALGAMIDVFTADELRAMVAFHGSDTGRAIAQKMPLYNDKIAPEINKRLDAAMADWLAGKAR